MKNLVKIQLIFLSLTLSLSIHQPIDSYGNFLKMKQVQDNSNNGQQTTQTTQQNSNSNQMVPVAAGIGGEGNPNSLLSYPRMQ